MTGLRTAGADGRNAPRAGTAAGQAPRRRGPSGWIRSHRGPAAAALVAVAALALVIGTQLAPKGDTVPLSVHNAGPNGAKALAQILGRHGVNIHTPGRFDAALADLRSSSSPTLLIYDRNGILGKPPR
jgi:hypothetical protein